MAASKEEAQNIVQMKKKIKQTNTNAKRKTMDLLVHKTKVNWILLPSSDDNLMCVFCG